MRTEVYSSDKLTMVPLLQAQYALECDDISSWAINQLSTDEASKVEALCTAIMVKSGEGMARTWVDGQKFCAFVFDRSLMLERLD